MRIRFLVLFALALSGMCQALTYFGPGTALNCESALIRITASDDYKWNDSSDGIVMKDGVGTNPCISIEANNVVVDCSARGNVQTIYGGSITQPGIYLAPGYGNITIKNCVIEQFLGSDIYIDGSGRAVTNVTINNTRVTWTEISATEMDGIACVDSDHITLDGVRADSQVMHGDVQCGLGNGRGGPATCSDVTILNSNFEWNSNIGIWLNGDRNRIENSVVDFNGHSVVGDPNHGVRMSGQDIYLRNNTISRSGDLGVWMDYCDRAQIIGNMFDDSDSDGLRVEHAALARVMDNNMTGNGGAGAYMYNSTGAVISGNIISGSGKGGIYLWGLGGIINENISVLNNQLIGNDYNLYVGESRGCTASGNSLTGANRGGFWQQNILDFQFLGNNISGSGEYGIEGRNVTNSLYEGNRITGNTLEGFYILNGSNNTFSGNLVQGNCIGVADSAVWLSGTCANWTLDSNNISGNGCYGLHSECTDVDADGLRIYGQDLYFDIDPGADADFTGLWLGLDDTYGVLWPALAGVSDTVINSGNFLPAQDFASLDGSDPMAAMLSANATVTINTSGCDNLQLYRAPGFPTSRAQILAAGTPERMLPPAMCAGSIATFGVSSFSGYAVEASELGGGGDGGGSRKQLTASAGAACPGDTVTFNITHAGAPVADVEVRLIQYAPYGGVVSTEYTGSEGTAEFAMAGSAAYHAYISKPGYYYLDPYVLEYEACGPAACQSEDECLDGEICADGACVPVAGECGYAAGHAWVPYECCADDDCGEGMTCSGNSCVATEAEKPPEEPPAAETGEGGSGGPAGEPMPPEGQEEGINQTAGVGGEMPAAEEPAAVEERKDGGPAQWLALLLLLIILAIIAWLGYRHLAKKS